MNATASAVWYQIERGNSNTPKEKYQISKAERLQFVNMHKNYRKQKIYRGGH